MTRMLSSVSPKGQVTIPSAIRRLLGIKPKDRVAFNVEGTTVTIEPAPSPLAVHYQSVPALDPPRSLDEITEIAREELAEAAAREGIEGARG